MSFKLENYLKNKRENLDVESPDDDLIWDGISKRIATKKTAEHRIPGRSQLIRIWNIAAAVIILFSLGYIANDILNGKNTGSNITLSSYGRDLGQREEEYRTLLELRTKEVRSFASSDDIVISELFNEIRELDVIYNQAISDLRELGPREKVINTIFSTYELKIRLLELIILETNKIKSHEENEKIIL